MDLLRAHAYLALLNGLDTTTPPASVLPAPAPSPDGQAVPSPAAGPACHDRNPAPATPVPAGLRRPPGADELPPMAGLISLAIPLTTLMQLSDAPGDITGYGPIDADTARTLTCALAGHRATRWQIIVTGPDNRALAAGTARGPAGPASGRPPPAPPGRTGRTPGGPSRSPPSPSPPATATTATPNPATGPAPPCNASSAPAPGTAPAPAAAAPPAATTSTTTPHDDGGITCECQIAPLCRFCHRLKQSQGWTLEQPRPGLMIWTTPNGRRYATLPSQHPT